MYNLHVTSQSSCEHTVGCEKWEVEKTTVFYICFYRFCLRRELYFACFFMNWGPTLGRQNALPGGGQIGSVLDTKTRTPGHTFSALAVVEIGATNCKRF